MDIRTSPRAAAALRFAGTLLAVAMPTALAQTQPAREAGLPHARAFAASPIETENDGLFYVNAEINGAAVRFLVDTGASVVVLTPEDAERVGVAGLSRASAVRMQTASGTAGMRWAKLAHLRIGRREVRNLDAAIVGDGLKVSLLGQNALLRLGPVTIDGNRLHLD